MLLILLSIFSLFGWVSDNQPEKIVFSSGSTQLSGFFYKPGKSKKWPVVIVVHSANEPLHGAPLYMNLQETLNLIGVAVFIYDRRGFGLSGGSSNTSDFATLAQDVLSAIDALKKRKDIDSSRIGVYGISQGSWVTPIAYSKNKSAIKFMILVSGCGVSPAEQMRYSAACALKIDGYSDSIVLLGANIRNMLDGYYRGKLQKTEVEAAINLSKNESWFPDLYLPNQGALPDTPCNTKWFHDMDFQPADYFRQINVPVLLIYGSTDRWVPIDKSIAVWNNSLIANHNRSFTIARIDHAGHMMILHEGTKNDQGVISSQYSELVRKWTLSMVRK